MILFINVTQKNLFKNPSFCIYLKDVISRCYDHYDQLERISYFQLVRTNGNPNICAFL